MSDYKIDEVSFYTTVKYMDTLFDYIRNKENKHIERYVNGLASLIEYNFNIEEITNNIYNLTIAFGSLDLKCASQFIDMLFIWNECEFIMSDQDMTRVDDNHKKLRSLYSLINPRWKS